MILDVQQGLAADGFHVSLVKLCRWFDLPRRTLYYRSVKSAPKVQEQLVAPIKAGLDKAVFVPAVKNGEFVEVNE